MNKPASPTPVPDDEAGAPASGLVEGVGGPAANQASSSAQTLSMPKAFLLVIGAATAFNIAYTFSQFSFLIAVYLWCLFQLTLANNARQAFYFGLLAGLLSIAPQSGFIWTIFGPAALALWTILAFWIGLFVALGRTARVRFGPHLGFFIIPFLWMGLEYFRSELYYLRFSWLNVGYVFAAPVNERFILAAGIYGVGFLLMAAIAWSRFLSRKMCLIANAGGLGILGLLVIVPPSRIKPPPMKAPMFIAGVQLEFPDEPQVLAALDRLVHRSPYAQLLVLSEYTFAGPLPDSLKQWCAKNRKYVVVGAEDTAPNGNYYDTAFVIGPTGEVVFKQGKCVPIQFFKDGLPATQQKLWDSPWGKIGFCICYDLSYTRITDELIRFGAQAIIVPTMDVVEWGQHQHELHARVAPARVAEYGVPIYRLASSGISQFIDEQGYLESAPIPGSGAMLCVPFRVVKQGGHLPWDRFLAKFSVAITALSICWFAGGDLLSFLRRKQKTT